MPDVAAAAQRTKVTRRELLDTLMSAAESPDPEMIAPRNFMLNIYRNMPGDIPASTIVDLAAKDPGLSSLFEITDMPAATMPVKPTAQPPATGLWEGIKKTAEPLLTPLVEVAPETVKSAGRALSWLDPSTASQRLGMMALKAFGVNAEEPIPAKVSAGLSRSIAQAGVDLTSPAAFASLGSYLVGAGEVGLGVKLATKLPRVARFLPSLLSAAATPAMLADLSSELPRAAEAYQKGDYEEMGFHIGNSISDILLGTAAIRGSRGAKRTAKATHPPKTSQLDVTPHVPPPTMASEKLRLSLGVEELPKGPGSIGDLVRQKLATVPESKAAEIRAAFSEYDTALRTYRPTDSNARPLASGSTSGGEWDTLDSDALRDVASKTRLNIEDVRQAASQNVEGLGRIKTHLTSMVDAVSKPAPWLSAEKQAQRAMEASQLRKNLDMVTEVISLKTQQRALPAPTARPPAALPAPASGGTGAISAEELRRAVPIRADLDIEAIAQRPLPEIVAMHGEAAAEISRLRPLTTTEAIIPAVKTSLPEHLLPSGRRDLNRAVDREQALSQLMELKRHKLGLSETPAPGPATGQTIRVTEPPPIGPPQLPPAPPAQTFPAGSTADPMVYNKVLIDRAPSIANKYRVSLDDVNAAIARPSADLVQEANALSTQLSAMSAGKLAGQPGRVLPTEAGLSLPATGQPPIAWAEARMQEMEQIRQRIDMLTDIVRSRDPGLHWRKGKKKSSASKPRTAQGAAVSPASAATPPPTAMPPGSESLASMEAVVKDGFLKGKHAIDIRDELVAAGMGLGEATNLLVRMLAEKR